MHIPALTYHKVEKKHELGMNVLSPAKFTEHVHWLKAHGFIGVTTKDTAAVKPLYLTFDDGYESIFTEAFPILASSEFSGIVFMISDFVGKTNTWDIHFGINRSRHLSRSQLVELSAAGWEIASHGCSHDAYTRLTSGEILKDMQHSKATLEDILGVPVNSFTPPFNAFQPNLFALAEQAGYRNVFIQKPLTPLRMNPPVRVIERRMVYNFDTVRNVVKKVEDSSRYELYKENIIHFCANATIGVKALLPDTARTKS